MITSTYIKRSIFIQKNTFSYSFDVSVDGIVGSLKFGFTDGLDGKIFEIKMENGKVYIGDDFVFSYEINKTLSFYGVVDETSHNLYIDDNLISLNAARVTGDVEWFYIDPVSLTADFSLSVDGEQPDYEISDISFDGESTTGQGTITNNSTEPFKIYGGSISPNTYTFTVLPGGNIVGSEAFSVVKIFEPTDSESLSSYEKDLTINLYTNFGKISKQIKDKTTFPLNQNLTLTIDSSISGTGELIGILEWENYNGEVLTDQDIIVPIHFEEVLSSGDFFNTWDFAISDIDGSNEIDFLTTDRTDLNNVLYKTNLGEYITNRIGSMRIKITRKLNGGTDTANLKIVGISETVEIEITGT